MVLYPDRIPSLGTGTTTLGEEEGGPAVNIESGGLDGPSRLPHEAVG